MLFFLALALLDNEAIRNDVSFCGTTNSQAHTSIIPEMNILALLCWRLTLFLLRFVLFLDPYLYA